MSDGAKQLYDSLAQYSDLDELIKGAEAEGLYLECKAPTAPQLTRDLRNTLGKALSGFSNTEGGIIIWGISTTKHAQSGLDVLSQIEPIGNCKLLVR
jgi:predicted HTH transcriptional regulator